LEAKVMAIYAIVPVKRIGVSKRRLSKSLSLQERKALTVAMLEDVLKALKASQVAQTVVVSNDLSVKSIAEHFGILFFRPTRRGLNGAIEEAWGWCTKKGATSVLVLPADVPLVSPRDINNLITLGSYGNTVVLAPSKDLGTNAFLHSAPPLINANFGPASFLKHYNEALSKNVCVKIFCSIGLGLDIDSVIDLKCLLKFENSTKSKQVVEKLSIMKIKV
jgi:2-phospho-L-lactate/phosphoenolpyruvate guanylyltransferase